MNNKKLCVFFNKGRAAQEPWQAIEVQQMSILIPSVTLVLTTDRQGRQNIELSLGANLQ